MTDRLAIAWAIYRAATPANLKELQEYGNAGPIADAVIEAIHSNGLSNLSAQGANALNRDSSGEPVALGVGLLPARQREDMISALTNAIDEKLGPRIEKLTAALGEMVYEATHLSPMEPDGSHWCRISAVSLERARDALRDTKGPAK